MKGIQRRRAGAALLAATAMLSVAACGRSTTDEKSAGSGGGAAQGVTDTSVKIGASVPVTGPIAGAGGALKNGLEIAVKEVNDAGGVNGRKIDLTALDDQYSTPKQVSNLRRMVSQDKVFALVDVVGTQLIPASWPYIEQTGIPFFGPISPADPKQKSVFVLGASLENQTAVATQYMIDQGAKRIGVLYLQGEVGEAEKRAVDAVVAKNPGVEVVSDDSLAIDDQNIKPYVLNAMKAKPDAFFLGNSNTQSYLILKEAQKRNWTPKFFGNGNTVTTPEIAKLKFADGLVSTTISQPLSADTDGIKTFIASAQKYTPGVDPTPQTLQSYVNAKVFFEILKRTGKDLSWPSFIKTAEGMSEYETGILPPVTFGAPPDGHEAAKDSLLTKLEGGKYQPITGKFVAPPE